MPAPISPPQRHSDTSSLPTFSTLGKATAGAAIGFVISTLAQAQGGSALTPSTASPQEPFCPLGMPVRSNNTATPHLRSLEFSSEVLSRYLKDGDIEGVKKAVGYQKDKNDVRKTPAVLSQKKSNHYLQQAEQAACPMDRAMLLHCARVALNGLLGEEFLKQIESLRYREAVACREVATLATNPYDKLA